MIFIPFSTPSSKNSKIKTPRGIFHSKTVMKYLRSLGIQHYSPSKKTVKEYKTRPNLFRKAFEESYWSKPRNIEFIGLHFVRGTKHKYDFGNASQIILDLMTSHDFIEDDNCDVAYAVPMTIDGRLRFDNEKYEMKFYSYDKENPGVYIKILSFCSYCAEPTNICDCPTDCGCT